MCAFWAAIFDIFHSSPPLDPFGFEQRLGALASYHTSQDRDKHHSAYFTIVCNTAMWNWNRIWHWTGWRTAPLPRMLWNPQRSVTSVQLLLIQGQQSTPLGRRDVSWTQTVSVWDILMKSPAWVSAFNRRGKGVGRGREGNATPRRKYTGSPHVTERKALA